MSGTATLRQQPAAFSRISDRFKAYFVVADTVARVKNPRGRKGIASDERSSQHQFAKDAIFAHARTMFADTARGESARPRARMTTADEVTATANAIRPAA